MNVVDVVVALALALAAVYGVRTGLVAGLSSLLGLVAGGVLGVVAAVVAADLISANGWRAVAVLALVLGGASLGATVGAAAGSRLSHGSWNGHRSLRLVDAAGGGLLAVSGVMVVAWLFASALLVPAVPAVAPVVGASWLVTSAERALPGSVRSAAHQWGESLVTQTLPRVLGEAVLPPSAPPQPAEAEVQAEPAVESARSATVKITGVAQECGVSVSGSGIVYSGERVMTAAHVVAGVAEPTVRSGRRSWPGTVVHFDAARDVAVLAVPGLDLPVLSFSSVPAEDSDRGVVAGYPGGGDYQATPAYVVRSLELVGPGWDGTPDTARDVYHLQSLIVSGYSGGPFLTPDGDVYGMVFAASRDHPGTGYALTAQELADDAAHGVASSEPVGNGSCDVTAA